MNTLKKRIFIGLAVLVFLLAFDLWTKYAIFSLFHLGESKPIFPGLNFTLVHNPGAAFGVGQKWSMLFFIGVSAVAIGFVVHFFLKLKPEEKLSYWGLIFILAGAFGNVVDRVRLGFVIDFIDVYVKTYHWWVFNVADSWITIGAVLFGLEILIFKKENSS